MIVPRGGGGYRPAVVVIVDKAVAVVVVVDKAVVVIWIIALVVDLSEYPPYSPSLFYVLPSQCDRSNSWSPTRPITEKSPVYYTQLPSRCSPTVSAIPFYSVR